MAYYERPVQAAASAEVQVPKLALCAHAIRAAAATVGARQAGIVLFVVPVPVAGATLAASPAFKSAPCCTAVSSCGSPAWAPRGGAPHADK